MSESNDRQSENASHSEIPHHLAEYIGGKVRDEIRTTVTTYWRQLRSFFFGVGMLVLGMLVLGLIDRGELIRFMHTKAFPSDSPDMVAISYEASFDLQGSDPRKDSGRLSFYATEGQDIKVFVHIAHRFGGDGEERRVVISVDEQPFGNPVVRWEGGFKLITDYVDWCSSPDREQSVHHIGFSLAQDQPPDLTDEVSIICVVLVYGNTM